MGGRSRYGESISFPGWTVTLETMIEQTSEAFKVAVACDRCRSSRHLDRKALEALRDQVGPLYSLVNRRCRCRLKPGCMGWNRFYYQSGVMRPLWDNVTTDRWIAQPFAQEDLKWVPAGIDPKAWFRADERQRKLLIRRARG